MNFWKILVSECKEWNVIIRDVDENDTSFGLLYIRLKNLSFIFAILKNRYFMYEEVL